MKHYKRFVKEIEQAADVVDLKKAIGTSRKGKAGLRDRIVSGRISWSEALSYVAIIQSIVIFTALIPNSIDTANGFLEWIGIPFQFPKEISSVAALFFVVGVFSFGLIAVRYVGTIKRTNEIGCKMNPGHILIYEKLIDMENRLRKIEEFVKCL